jgi:hypothetical protein
VTVAKEPDRRGELEGNRKTTARGMPGDSGVTVATTCTLSAAAHRRPAFPAPSDREGKEISSKTRATCAARSRRCVLHRALFEKLNSRQLIAHALATPSTIITRERACEECRPHPEELAKQASRRMVTTHGLAAILRDARKGALLRMRKTRWRGMTALYGAAPRPRLQHREHLAIEAAGTRPLQPRRG